LPGEPRWTIFFEHLLLEKKLQVEIRAIKLLPVEITVRNKVPSENIIARTLFLSVIYRLNRRGTYFIAHISNGGHFLLATYF
jgi:hypothetical protein